MKKHILCLGDSNTHGYCADPTDCADGGLRFNESERWTQRLQNLLGEEYLVVEEGLPSRTTCFEDPFHEGMNALKYIAPCLKSHEPIDLLVIMLGTNDVKDRFSASAGCVAMGLGRLIRKARSVDCWGDHEPNILVVCPPPIGEGMLHIPAVETMGAACVEKSRRLAHYFKEQCDLLGCHFLDAAQLGAEFNTVDFMHLTRKGHAALADGLAKHIPDYL